MKRALLLVVLLAVAGGYWWLQRQEETPLPVAREVAPQRWQVATSANVSASETALNATLSEQPDQNASVADNATLPVIPDDDIVRHDFIQDLSSYLVARYLPGGSTKNPANKGRFDLNVKSANMRYGVDFPGMNVNATDTLGARKTIFRHVLQGPVLDFLYAAYAPLFLDNLEQALNSATCSQADGQDVPLTPEQRQEMRTLLATRLRAVGRTVGMLAGTASIRPLVTSYLEEIEKVSQAHLAFWNLQEGASGSVVNEANVRIKTSIQNREMARQRLLQAIVSASDPQGMDAAELVYLAQWVYRRGTEDEKSLSALAKAAELLVRTASAVEAPPSADLAPAAGQ